MRRPDKGAGAEDKIAAIGIRVRRWVTLPRRQPQRRAGPLAFRRHRAVRRRAATGVTSLVDLGMPVTMPEADGALRGAFEDVFGKTVQV